MSVLTETRKATEMFKSRVFLTRRSLEIMLLGSHARRINMPISNATKHEAQRIYPAARVASTVGSLRVLQRELGESQKRAP